MNAHTGLIVTFVNSRNVITLSLSLAAGALAGCHTSAAEPTAPVMDSAVAVDAGTPFRIDARAVDLGVYLPTAVPSAVLSATQDSARKRFPKLAVLTQPAETHSPGVFIFAPDIAGFPVPSVEQLAYIGRGLNTTQAQTAASSKGVMILAWKLDRDPQFARLRDAQKFALDVAQKNSGFVWDETTRQLYSVDAWQKARVDGWDGDLPDMRHDITIHYYETDTGQHRAITLGMVKFGLPDIVVADVRPSAAGPMTTLMDAAAQILVEGAQVGATGELQIDLQAIHHSGVRGAFIAAAGKTATVGGVVTLLPARPQKGDPDNRLVEMGFGQFQGHTESVRQGAALSAILGAHLDTTAAAPPDDAEMAAAVARAQARLPEVANAFRQGLPHGEHMMVEAQFDTDEGRVEWLWVGVSSWPDDVVHGTLVNDPKGISALRRGAKVEAAKHEIVDYMWIGADGKTKEGGETDAILKKRNVPQ